MCFLPKKTKVIRTYTLIKIITNIQKYSNLQYLQIPEPRWQGKLRWRQFNPEGKALKTGETQ